MRSMIICVCVREGHQENVIGLSVAIVGNNIHRRWSTMNTPTQKELLMKMMTTWQTDTVYYELDYNAVAISVDRSAKRCTKISSISLIIKTDFSYVHLTVLHCFE